MYIATSVPLPSQWRLPGTLSPPTYSPSQCPVQVLWGWSKSLLGFFHVTEKPKQAFWPTQDFLGLPGWLSGKGSACNTGTQVRSLGWEDPLVEEMATHSSILTWRIPWAGEPGRLQSVRSQTVVYKQLSKHHPKYHSFIQSISQQMFSEYLYSHV